MLSDALLLLFAFTFAFNPYLPCILPFSDFFLDE